MHFRHTAECRICEFLDYKAEILENRFPLLAVVVEVFSLNFAVDVCETLDFVAVDLDGLDRMEIEFEEFYVGLVDVIEQHQPQTLKINVEFLFIGAIHSREPVDRHFSFK